ncbi:MAG TPA: TolC family protein [Gemmataceae bacterium]|nr:TolC family protein [Gemmataceae bacterium]
MRLRRTRELTLPLSLLLFGGCSSPLWTDSDHVPCELAARPIDVRPVAAAAGEESQAPAVAPKPAEPPVGEAGLREPLPVPREVPGAEAAPVQVPKIEPGKEAERERQIDRLFPPLPPLGENPQPLPCPDSRPLELHDLQELALTNSPLLKQALAEVEAARGAMIQAGAYPNPTMGFEDDAIGQGGLPVERVTAGQIGGFVDQTIKTKGKLRLARSAAEQDLHRAEYALRRAQSDLMAQVRGGYFAVLATQESMRVALAFARFTEAIYRIQVGQLKAGVVADYEPLQFRALAVQARVNLAQARHRYVSAWKQLAAAMGVPGLSPAPLGGHIDMPIPVYCYDDVAAQVLARHTDVLTARAALERARLNLRLAQVTPYPDLDVRVLVQKDYTGDPRLVMTSVQIGGPIPIWDHNRGNIIQAEAHLVRATEEEHRVRADLARQVADAFERYNLNRELLAPYRSTVLPDQVRVFNGIFDRYLAQGKPPRFDVNFIDVSTAQQNLATSVTAYLQALAAQWQAVVDIAALLQTEDLFQVGAEPVPTECLPPLPDLDKLLPLPCKHAGSQVDPALRGTVDPAWPAALPQPEPEQRPAPSQR